MTEELSLGARVLEAIRAGRANRNARLAAARGALPLTPAELLLVQVLLAGDEDAEIADAARTSLDAFDAPTAEHLAADPATDVAVLEFLAASPNRWPVAARLLAASTRIPPRALRVIAGSSLGEALAILVTNNLALSADAELGRLLSVNPALGGSERLRLLDYLDELGKRRPEETVPPQAAADEEIVLEPARDPFLAALGIDAEVERMLPELGLDMGALAERSELLGEAEDEDEASLINRLQRMNIGQKLRVALFGGREERMVLIRDSNRLVSSAVVKNPKFTAHEAEAAANSRNVNAEVLRLVARHRDFGQTYSIQHALVKNPRVPPDLQLPLVPVLNDRDLRLLLKNRNISEMVRRHAKKIIDTREERRRVRLGPQKH